MGAEGEADPARPGSVLGDMMSEVERKEAAQRVRESHRGACENLFLAKGRRTDGGGSFKGRMRPSSVDWGVKKSRKSSLSS